MVAGVEVHVDTPAPAGADGPLHVRLLGPLTIRRNGAALPLPASRKVRGLFGYLALAPRPAARSHLCELLWDVPNDPRGELRWALSKIRGLVDEPARQRVYTRDDTVGIDLADCFVDAITIARAADEGFGALDVQGQREFAALFGGDLLEGLELDRSPVFGGWLTAQRRRFRACETALLEHLVAAVSDDEALGYLERWLVLSPFDPRAHERLLNALALRGRIREGEEHLAAAIRLFEAEGLDAAPLRQTWNASRARAGGAQRLETPPKAREFAADSPEAGAGDRRRMSTIAPRRASLAVMPFADTSPVAGARGGAADALAHDVITRLAKLRSLLVIAQGTVFALHERGIASEEASRMLDVDYVASGSVRRDGDRLRVTVELVETRSARIVWTETFDRRADDTLAVLDEIGNCIVSSIDTEIETVERNRAILKPPESLDAWESHHRALWHMYRFSKVDNEQARLFFETAVRLDPTFARAWAGLSFTHFQNAFQGWTERESEVDRAYAAAGQSLMADDRDPAAHWAMGRALWLRGANDDSVTELRRSIDLSPNFALGHYTMAFVQSQAGDPRAAISSSDHSRRLSPFDPLLFGMLGARAMALVRLGEFEQAAEWAVKAAARPNAHPHILAIAAFTLALAGSLDEARAFAAAIRRDLPRYGVGDFLAAFHFDAQGEARFREGARRIGMG